MNKKLITMAVAAAMLAPLAAVAETTLYGSVRPSVDSWDDGSGDSSVMDVRDNYSRIGVKGSEDLGSGLKAIFQFEWGLAAGDDKPNQGYEGGSYGGGLANRIAQVGLNGGWGTGVLGRMTTPYKNSVDKGDIFNSARDQSAAYVSDVAGSRIGNALAYVSPDFNGFSGRLMLVMDDDNEHTPHGTEDGVDIWNVSADYNNGPLSAGLSYAKAQNDDENSDIWGIAGRYNWDMFALIGVYEDGDIRNAAGTGTDSHKEWTIAGEGYFGNNTIRARYGDRSGDDDGTGWGLGYQYNFSTRTRVWAEYHSGDEDLNTTVDDTTVISLGMRHDF